MNEQSSQFSRARLGSQIGRLRECIVHWYLSTTDGGSNEMGGRRIIHSDVKDLPNVFFLDTTCLQHAQHLISLSGLKAADRSLKGVRDWTYYSSLAVCSHVCRDVGRELYGAWVTMVGAASAKKTCKALFPKACAGRWSGCDKPEQRFLQCGEHDLSSVLGFVLRSKVNAKVDDKPAQSVNDLAIEEAKEYSEKMGKWRRRCLECISDSLWWRCLQVMNATRKPMAHLSNFLQKIKTSEQATVNHMYELCAGKASEIFHEFEHVWPDLENSGCVRGDDEESAIHSEFCEPLA